MGTDGWNDVVIAGTCFLEQHRILHACLIEQTDVRGSSRKLLPVGPVATDVTVLAALAGNAFLTPACRQAGII